MLSRVYEISAALVFLVVIIASWYIQSIDSINLVAVFVFTLLIFLAVWCVGFFSLREAQKLSWEYPSGEGAFDRFKERWRRLRILLPKLFFNNKVHFLALGISVIISIYFLGDYAESFDLAPKGSYSLNGGVCTVRLEGEVLQASKQVCERVFHSFYVAFYSVLQIFAFMNVVFVFVLAPLIGRYNEKFNRFGK